MRTREKGSTIPRIHSERKRDEIARRNSKSDNRIPKTRHGETAPKVFGYDELLSRIHSQGREKMQIPLNHLLKDQKLKSNAPIQWSTEALKDVLSNAALLAHPSDRASLVKMVDAISQKEQRHSSEKKAHGSGF